LAQLQKKKKVAPFLAALSKLFFSIFCSTLLALKIFFLTIQFFFKIKTQSFDVLSLIRFFNNKVLSNESHFFETELGGFSKNMELHIHHNTSEVTSFHLSFSKLKSNNNKKKKKTMKRYFTIFKFLQVRLVKGIICKLSQFLQVRLEKGVICKLALSGFQASSNYPLLMCCHCLTV